MGAIINGSYKHNHLKISLDLSTYATERNKHLVNKNADISEMNRLATSLFVIFFCILNQFDL